MSILCRCVLAIVGWAAIAIGAAAGPIMSAGKPARLEIRSVGEHSIRVSLVPIDFKGEVASPGVVQRFDSPPALRIEACDELMTLDVGVLRVEVRPGPLRVAVSDARGRRVQEVTFEDDGRMSFATGEAPILGMGEGGPLPGKNWREQAVQFDRRGANDDMRPRWQGDMYGSRNPVALLVGTEGWALWAATPWVSVDLRQPGRGVLEPWKPPPYEKVADPEAVRVGALTQLRGRPFRDTIVPGLCDVFVFDAHDPSVFMNELAELTGRAAMPPKWALGYMQSHRTLVDDEQMVKIVDTFREKKIPLDAVIYLGTGFTPQGWNTEQPSFEFNPKVFKRAPSEVIGDLHARHARVVLHMVPPEREKMWLWHGTIPAAEGETLDAAHIQTYWKQHEPLMAAGADAFWPDEGDWLHLDERMKRHEMYYSGPLSTNPNVRPWSLHRNGYLGVARWGGWIWSGDTDSSWKTLEAQVAVGINHSLSLSPYWGSDIGGFVANPELTGELYARWFQFGAFCPSFRSHGRTWQLRLPWGWGQSDMGPRETKTNPLESSLNDQRIEPICRQYAELRMWLMPYTYTLAREARDAGLPLMRSLWLHYPEDENVRSLGSEYLWGRDLLVAPVFAKGATSRSVYLPKGDWYDWWTDERIEGGRTVERDVDLATMPIYVRAGAIVPVDPVRQYVDEKVEEPTTLRVYTGADGAFTLYEDDGETLDYLAGKSVSTRVTWDDAGRRLVIEPAPGTKPPAERRTFRVETVPGGQASSVDYVGERVEVTVR